MSNTVLGEDGYNKLIEDSVAAGIAELKKSPALAFVFKVNADGLLIPEQQNVSALSLIGAMSSKGDHSEFTMQTAFKKLQDAAVQEGRSVERKLLGPDRYATVFTGQRLNFK